MSRHEWMTIIFQSNVSSILILFPIKDIYTDRLILYTIHPQAECGFYVRLFFLISQCFIVILSHTSSCSIVAGPLLAFIIPELLCLPSAYINLTLKGIKKVEDEYKRMMNSNEQQIQISGAYTSNYVCAIQQQHWPHLFAKTC